MGMAFELGDGSGGCCNVLRFGFVFVFYVLLFGSFKTNRLLSLRNLLQLIVAADLSASLLTSEVSSGEENTWHMPSS